MKASNSSGEFVVVTKPLPNINGFLEWVSEQHLPNAQAVVNNMGTNRRDELVIFVDRHSFVDDLLSGFSPKHGTGGADTDKTGEVPNSHWERIWTQFCRDLPRQRFRVAGHHITNVDEVQPAVTQFVKSLPPCATRRALSLGTDSPQAKAASSDSYLWGMLKIMASPFTTAAASPTAGAASIEGSELKLASENVMRLVALFSQQSVLALIYEALHQQYLSGVDGELFLGEPKPDERAAESSVKVKRESPLSDTGSPSTMCVDIRLRPVDQAVIVEVRKLFRVFMIHDSDDHTLFMIPAKLTANLLAADDPVELAWAVRPPEQQHSICECFGASAGYHKQSCPAAKNK